MKNNGQKSPEDLRQELIGQLLDRADKHYEQADLLVQAARELQRLNNRLAYRESEERLEETRYRRTKSIEHERLSSPLG